MRILSAIFLFCSFWLQAQPPITGIILNTKDEPVGFCHVVNKSMELGKVSDINGKFEITAKKGDTVIFSYVGYKTLELEITALHIINYIKIMLPEDSLLLPSITIYADPNYKVPLNLKGEPIYMQGVTVDDKSDPIKAGTIRPGVVTGPGMVPMMGGTIYGPITYFSSEEREKRRAQEAYQEYRETVTYQKFVAEDSVKNNLCHIYRINTSQYDEIMVRLNTQFPGIQKQYNPAEIWNWLIFHFDRSVRIFRN